ncbi:hypothetical protein CSB08_00130 [Candidatus Gracilibacteria bacterium]|nr:MAG: hypothetical protein CSB08_00130 [Candidatus Gracilibacteria bacterium]PIE85685.1 MAG: hypothetical protein CSA08_00610 [Candidatus Gracilibacteria bacterium]
MKTIRTGVYALLKYQDKIIVIKKGRGPFKGLYDLPGGKIEHGEKNLDSLKREIIEEIGLKKSDFEVEKLLTVEEDFVQHIWKTEEKEEHIIAIVYVVNIISQNINLDFIEEGGDANGLKFIDFKDIKTPKTNILQKVLKKV